ncbi:hypothetical protein [Onishia niordana]|uniref:hypothetical protein n=1 Tax=Onishia niordana TaxID=2508711 RepID=UPI0010A09340|nr:hypothetical protein [Halomonas niordiana]
MFNWMERRSPSVWAIKQIDANVIHLCGRGEAAGPDSARKRRKELAENRYQGTIRLEYSGMDLHASLFEALVLIDDLVWLDECYVRWQDRRWCVAWVPERCWTYQGPLILEASMGPGKHFTSTEDVSAIREKASAPASPVPSSRWWDLAALGDEQRRFDYTSPPDLHRLTATSQKHRTLTRAGHI